MCLGIDQAVAGDPDGEVLGMKGRQAEIGGPYAGDRAAAYRHRVDARLIEPVRGVVERREEELVVVPNEPRSHAAPGTEIRSRAATERSAQDAPLLVPGPVHGGSRWVITDNTFIGGYEAGIGATGTPGDSEYRSCLCSGDGNVFAYNSTTRFDDGINIGTNTDTYGNQIWEHQDDLISTDGGGRNVRVWGNRAHAVAGYATSHQPQGAGPWYYLYNQLAEGRLFKWRWSDRLDVLGGHNNPPTAALEPDLAPGPP